MEEQCYTNSTIDIPSAEHDAIPSMELEQNASRHQKKQQRRRFERATTVSGGLGSVANSALRPAALDLLYDWIDEATRSAEEYTAATSKFSCINKCLRWCVRILSAAIGTGSIFEVLKMDAGDPDSTYKITIAVVSALLLIIVSAEEIFAPADRTHSLRATRNDYRNFVRETRLELSTGVDDRSDKCEQFMLLREKELSDIEAEAQSTECLPRMWCCFSHCYGSPSDDMPRV